MRKGLLLVLLLLMVVSGTALAQTTTGEVYCGTLSAEDCALLEQSHTARQNLTAAAFDLFVDIQVESAGEDTSISLVGSGAYSGLSPMSPDSTTSTDDVLAALGTFNAELMLTATVPPELTDGSNTPNTITLDLRLVDGVGYINFDPLQPLINDPAFTGWGGLDLAGLVGALVAQNPDFIAELGSMAAGSGVNPAMLSNIDHQAVEQYLMITRTDDGSGATATFETTVDFAGLMADPAFQDMLSEQLDASGEDMSEADRAEALGMMNEAFQHIVLLIRQEIDTASGNTASLSVEFDIDMTELDDDANDGSVAVTAMINYDYENVMTITMPENASVMPYQQLLDMVGGMLGGMGDALGDSTGGTSAGGSMGETTPTPTPEATAAG